VEDAKYLSLRAEAEAPFRAFRVVFLGFLAFSASVATLFSIPQLIGAIGNAPNAQPLEEAVQSFGINVGVCHATIIEDNAYYVMLFACLLVVFALHSH
jgi:hypothetical protein